MGNDNFDLEALLKEGEAALEQFPYDIASAHYESEDYPEDLPDSAASTHIGMYLGWAIERELISVDLKEKCKTMIIDFNKGSIMPSEIIRSCCNNELSQCCLNELGNAFTKQYYWSGWKYSYSRDYDKLAGWPEIPQCYYFQDTRENFERVKSVIDERFKEWLSEQNQN